MGGRDKGWGSTVGDFSNSAMYLKLESMHACSSTYLPDGTQVIPVLKTCNNSSHHDCIELSTTAVHV